MAMSAFLPPFLLESRSKRSLKKVPLVRDAAHAASTSVAMTYLSPWLVFPLFFLPALSQHILGNLFRNERLERQFDEWHLGQFVRAGEKFDIKKHKHIFVYAIYGYVSTLDEDLRQWFISKYIIGEAEHLLNHRKRNRNLLAQADDIVRKTDGRRLTLEMEQTAEGLHKAKAMLSDGTLLCEAESKSWRYARQKVTKLALDILAMPSRKYILSNPEYQARILAREEEKIAKRKAENARRAAIKAAKEARPMSSKKRRFLEDKKK